MNAVSTTIDAWLAVSFAGLAALVVAHFVARFAARSGALLDRPNARSSHRVVTPRSGGVAVFAGWATGMAIVAAFAGAPLILDSTVRLMLLAGFALLIGLADDLYAPRALFKFGGQVMAAVLFVLVFGAPETAPLPFVGDTALGAFAAPLTVFWIVAFMNAFNFMDGVNGIAAACGAFALFAIAVAAAFSGAFFWALAAAICGTAIVAFLPVNFPRGRLFMGDNGSQTIGFLIAAIAVGAAMETGGATSALFIPVAMLPFIFDVSFTLAHRILRKQDVLAAHREHLYQLLLRTGSSHAEVTGLYLSLTALSTAAAVLMLRLSPAEQWYAAVAAALLMMAPAMILFLRARRMGLLAPPVLPASSHDEAPADSSERRVHAAE